MSAVVTLHPAARKAERRAERERELAHRIRALPDKRYGVIYADPPWRFEPWSIETGMDRAADNHYPTMAIEEIIALPVESRLAAQSAALFMWATVPMLVDALAVVDAWGFAYRSHVVWDKVKPGTGYWVRNSHELLLICGRGKIPAPAIGSQWPQSIVRKVKTEHSRKPQIFRAMIEQYFPTLPKVELFARGAASPGWDAWGQEAEA